MCGWKFPWVRDYFMASARVYVPAIPHFLPIWIKMDIRKVKVDQLTLLACIPCSLSLVTNLEEEASVICIGLFGHRYFIKINWKINGKMLGFELKQCLLWAQVSNFNLVKVGSYPLLPLAVIAFKVVHCLLLYLLYIRVKQCSIIRPKGP